MPEIKRIDLFDLIREIVEMSGLPESIATSVEIPSTLPPALGDRQQLSIVFTNLIRNARDAMPNGGKLHITARAGDNAAGAVEIDLADTGGGILPEHLGRIMDPLFSTKARGIGLGLSISRAIVEKHNGQLKVKSNPERGTTFTVRLKTAAN